MNSFYVPALAGQIYAMAGMQTRLQMLADAPGKFVGRNTQYSGGGFSDQFFEVLATSPADFDAWVAKAKQAPAKLDAAAYAKLAEKSRLLPITYYSAFEPKLFDSIIAKYTHGHQAHGQAAAGRAGAEIERMFGKLTIEALPLYSAIAATGALVTVGGALLVFVVDHLAQGVAVPVDRVADQRRPQAHRHHVHRAGADHAAARLRRRHHDARPAGDGAQQRRLPAARAFRPDLQLARHHHDLLHGHAVHDRADEHRRSPADRHARRRLPVPELAQPVADRRRRRAGHGVAGDRQVLDRRLDRLSALFGHRVQPGRRRRLLDLGAADQRRRLDPVRASISSSPSSSAARRA